MSHYRCSQDLPWQESGVRILELGFKPRCLYFGGGHLNCYVKCLLSRVLSFYFLMSGGAHNQRGCQNVMRKGMYLETHEWAPVLPLSPGNYLTLEDDLILLSSSLCHIWIVMPTSQGSCKGLERACNFHDIYHTPNARLLLLFYFQDLYIKKQTCFDIYISVKFSSNYMFGGLCQFFFFFFFKWIQLFI